MSYRSINEIAAGIVAINHIAYHLGDAGQYGPAENAVLRRLWDHMVLEYGATAMIAAHKIALPQMRGGCQ